MHIIHKRSAIASLIAFLIIIIPIHGMKRAHDQITQETAQSVNRFFLDTLPVELWTAIIRFSIPNTRNVLRLVCTALRALASQANKNALLTDDAAPLHPIDRIKFSLYYLYESYIPNINRLAQTFHHTISNHLNGIMCYRALDLSNNQALNDLMNLLPESYRKTYDGYLRATQTVNKPSHVLSLCYSSALTYDHTSKDIQEQFEISLKKFDSTVPSLERFKALNMARALFTKVVTLNNINAVKKMLNTTNISPLLKPDTILNSPTEELSYLKYILEISYMHSNTELLSELIHFAFPPSTQTASCLFPCPFIRPFSCLQAAYLYCIGSSTQSNKPQFLKLLIEYANKMSACNPYLPYALYYALEKGKWACVDMLLKHSSSSVDMNLAIAVLQHVGTIPKGPDAIETPDFLPLLAQKEPGIFDTLVRMSTMVITKELNSILHNSTLCNTNENHTVQDVQPILTNNKETERNAIATLIDRARNKRDAIDRELTIMKNHTNHLINESVMPYDLLARENTLTTLLSRLDQIVELINGHTTHRQTL